MKVCSPKNHSDGLGHTFVFGAIALFSRIPLVLVSGGYYFLLSFEWQTKVTKKNHPKIQPDDFVVAQASATWGPKSLLLANAVMKFKPGD